MWNSICFVCGMKVRMIKYSLLCLLCLFLVRMSQNDKILVRSQNDKILFALFTFLLVWNESQNDKIFFALFTFILVWNESQNDKILFALFTFLLVNERNDKKSSV